MSDYRELVGQGHAVVIDEPFCEKPNGVAVSVWMTLDQVGQLFLKIVQSRTKKRSVELGSSS